MRTGSRPWMGLVLSVLVLLWTALPALAHGEEGESDPVNLVEQALAIVVNTPNAADEALERVEEALETEEAEPFRGVARSRGGGHRFGGWPSS